MERAYACQTARQTSESWERDGGRGSDEGGGGTEAR